MKRTVVIGGGTSGIFAAIQIKELCPSMEVVLVERLERIGKKILATGNGRCNFSNSHVNSTKYNNSSFVGPIIGKLSYSDLCNKLEEMGLMMTEDSEGRAYPYSESANSFLDILRINMKMQGIIEKCNFEVKHILPLVVNKKSKYIVEDTRKQEIEADYVVIATGGKAYPILGSNGSGYNLLKPWKVKITDTEPGLVGVKVDPQDVKGLSGIRVKAKVSLWEKKSKKLLWSELGEVLFKEDGLSGIVIMQLASRISRYMVNKTVKSFFFDIDLLPQTSENDLLILLIKRQELMKEIETGEFLNGIFAKNIGHLIMKRSKVDLSARVNDLTSKDLIRIVSIIKRFSFEYKGLYGYDRAQVTVGGIDLNEISNKTLELYKVPNVFVCGEVMDIDGECGGYNMHFALASANVVAQSIQEKEGYNEQS
ncbi:MAG: NAD(P)/FAD-dependent oxidoreductase [Bacilli bacterium]